MAASKQRKLDSETPDPEAAFLASVYSRILAWPAPQEPNSKQTGGCDRDRKQRTRPGRSGSRRASQGCRADKSPHLNYTTCAIEPQASTNEG